MATTTTSTRARLVGNRRIVSIAEAQTPADGYLTRIVKYVPTEFITVYLTLNNFVGDTKGGTGDKLTVNQYWVAFAVLLVVNAIYLLFATRQNGKGPAINQVVISTILYAIFIYAVGGPFKEAGDYNLTLATVLLPVALFIAGFIDPNPSPAQLKAQ